MRLCFVLALALAAAACYRPQPPDGAACAPGGVCPTPLVCDQGVCVAHAADAALAGDVRFADSSPSDSASVDGARLDAPSGCAPPPIAAFATPVENLELSSGALDGTPSETADQLDLFFKSERSGSGDHLFTAHRAAIGSAWSTPAVVAELEGGSGFSERSPEIAPDGLTIWFSSDVTGSLDFYTATRASRTATWDAPVRIPELSTPGVDEGFAILPSLRVAYFHSDETGGGVFHIYRTTRAAIGDAWSTPVEVAELGTGAENPWVSADECTIYYDVSAANDDLYVATRPAPGAPFGTAQPLTALNSTGDDDDPWLTADQRYIIFSSTRTGGLGNWDLYEASR